MYPQECKSNTYKKAKIGVKPREHLCTADVKAPLSPIYETEERRLYPT